MRQNRGSGCLMVNHNAFAQGPPPVLLSLGCSPPDLQWPLGKKLRTPGVVKAGRRKGCRPSGFRTAELVPRLPLQELHADLGQRTGARGLCSHL